MKRAVLQHSPSRRHIAPGAAGCLPASACGPTQFGPFAHPVSSQNSAGNGSTAGRASEQKTCQGKHRDKTGLESRMRESYEKGLASRSAPTPTLAMVTWRVWHGQGVHAGQVFSSEITTLACPHCPDGGRQHVTRRSWRVVPQRGGVSDPVHVRKLQSREPGDPIGFRFASWHVHDVAERWAVENLILTRGYGCMAYYGFCCAFGADGGYF